MLVRLLSVAVTLGLLLLAGCGGGGASHGQRTRVSAYIQRVNSVEFALAAPLAQVTQASGRLARARTPHQLAAVNATLARTEAQIQTLEGRLAALPAPSAATRLRSLLLELAAGQLALTHQTRLLSGFLPRYSVDLAPLAGSTLRLERAIAPTSATGAAAVAALTATKADAFDRFRIDLTRVVRRLRRLSPPAVSLPAFRAQVRTLEGMAAGSRALAQALRSPNPAPLAPLFQRFSAAAAGNQSIAVQRAQIAAVRSYDGQARRLDLLVARIQQQEALLSRTVR